MQSSVLLQSLKECGKYSERGRKFIFPLSSKLVRQLYSILPDFLNVKSLSFTLSISLNRPRIRMEILFSLLFIPFILSVFLSSNLYPSPSSIINRLFGHFPLHFSSLPLHSSLHSTSYISLLCFYLNSHTLPLTHSLQFDTFSILLPASIFLLSIWYPLPLLHWIHSKGAVSSLFFSFRLEWKRRFNLFVHSTNWELNEHKNSSFV